MADKYECQPEGWADPPDPDMHAAMWADSPRKPRGWIRCSGCGQEWHRDDGDCCTCEEEEE